MALLYVGASPAVFTDCALHNHDCYEIILNVEGTGTAEIGGKEYPFTPGSIHVIPPHTPHRKQAEQGFRDLYLHTDTLQRGDTPQFAAPPMTEPLLLADDGCRTMEGLFSILLGRSQLNRGDDEITQVLFDVVLRLLAEWSQAEPSDPVVSSVIHTIATSYSDPEFEVTQALLATGYSKDHLRRRFTGVPGSTPNQYLRTVRMNHARQLLRQESTLHLSINEIALMCGFYDPSYFCRSFVKETGMTPTAYMRSRQRKSEGQDGDPGGKN